jgi:hypothetical protein
MSTASSSFGNTAPALKKFLLLDHFAASEAEDFIPHSQHPLYGCDAALQPEFLLGHIDQVMLR